MFNHFFVEKSVGELIQYYKKGKVIIDLHFNGPERTIWEAILYECYPLISHHGNGGDDIDIPIPSQYKIDAIDADLNHEGIQHVGTNGHKTSNKLTNDLIEMLRYMLQDNHDIQNNLAIDFQPFLNKVVQMPQQFRRSIKQTFSSASLTFVLGRDHLPPWPMPQRYQVINI